MMKLPFMNAILNELVEMNTQRISVNSGLSKGDIARLIEVNSRYSGSTPLRRASSVIRWFEWLSANYGLFQVRNGHLYLYRHIQSRIS